MKSHTSGSSGRRDEDHDVPLATKTVIPPIRSELLPRTPLMRQVEEAIRHELVLISTPAGFGKTTLLASWAKTTSKPVAWLSLDGDDNDPMRFWRYVVAAVGRVQKTMVQPALSLLDDPAQPTSKAVITALVNELAADPEELVLILDDYQRIETPAIHEDLAFLLERIPPALHIVLSTRSDPPLPLARFRARGQLAELRAADLRFTPSEAASFLHNVWGLNVSQEAVTVLEERTEGWVTGLQLAALALRGASDPAQFIQEFTGSHRYILDYLMEEVLERQPGDVQSFLLKTSILDQLCGPLCDLLTGRRDGQQMLADLERANLFLVPLDEGRQWYRYHRLFADLLLVRLQVSDPQLVPELHRNAATWYEEHGWLHEAVPHALAAGKTAWAARLVEEHGEELLRRGERGTLQRWLSILPSEVMRSRPRLILAQAIAALNAGRVQMVEALLDDAEQALAVAPNESYDPSISRGMSMLANVPAAIALLRASLAAYRGDAERTIELVHQAQAHLGKNERGPNISVRWNLAQADWMQGRLAEAERAFANILAEGREAGELYLTLTAGSILGHIQQARGRLEAALRTYQEGLQLAAGTGSKVVLSTAGAHIGMAQVFYERNRLEEALTHVMEGIALSRQLVSTQTLVVGLITLAWARQATGDQVGARNAMEEAHQSTQDLEAVSLHDPAPAEWARLSLAQGDKQAAARWVEKRVLDERIEPDYARELDHLVLARTLLHRRLPDQAFALLERLAAAAKDQERLGSLIKIQVLQTLSFQAAGKSDLALKTLAAALVQAEPEGYVRTFVDEGPPMAALLHQAALRGVTPEYVARLLAVFPPLDQGVQPSPAFSFNEPLSKRELEILRLLASGASNQEIAAFLSIAPTTAKKHVSNIIRKLGVSNRTQSVARGRDLGLL